MNNILFRTILILFGMVLLFIEILPLNFPIYNTYDQYICFFSQKNNIKLMSIIFGVLLILFNKQISLFITKHLLRGDEL